MDLLITIDTEEDNWDSYTRTENTLQNIDKIARLQQIFDRFGAKPTYLISYPVATDPRSIEILNDIRQTGRCEIGTHCHPWNTPPFYEEINERNSMLCNLDESLVFRKLENLHSIIQRNFGIEPTSFRAGRWGFCEPVARALFQLGYRVDSSVSPFVSWEEYQGVDFEDFQIRPYRFDPDCIKNPVKDGKLLQVPVTIGYLYGELSKAHMFAKTVQSGIFKKMRLHSIINRIGRFYKIWLSPEHSDLVEMTKVSRSFEARDINFLNMTFHSTSLMHGLTPFNRTQDDEEKMFSLIERYLEFAAMRRYRFRTLSDFATDYPPPI